MKGSPESIVTNREHKACIHSTQEKYVAVNITALKRRVNINLIIIFKIYG